ncbi:formate dehydrogenase accessory sulfurtransferase FdhD [Spongisporangium articulatum]|uniref:Sulfur carrier protein FdhD n=1 Tax=Spongisporangium articulatum TaxID=3362603 RepID=A0ABW8ALB1_9ACTN
MGRVTARRRVTRITIGAAGEGAGVSRREDVLAVEEPLELRVAGEPFSVTMRTPGHDFELAAGFLVGEGVVAHSGQLGALRYCAGVDEHGENTYNVLDVVLGPGVAPPGDALRRNVYTSSSCGLCGKASIEAVRTRSHHAVRGDDLRVTADWLVTLPATLRAGQRGFDQTGGLHAAALFDAATGELLVLREDVGRHNAVDKVVGWALTADRLPLSGTVLMLSGRAGFELVQKASMAGIACVAAVSAPSSLAVELAAEVGMTLVGFVRDPSLVVYAGAERVLTGAQVRA